METMDQFSTDDRGLTVFRFDVFKGVINREGKINKVRSVGIAYNVTGNTIFRVSLKTFLKDEFFLLPERDCSDRTEFSILTRSLSNRPGKKYFWHTVGSGKTLSGANAGLMELKWDLFGEDIFLNLCPKDSYAIGAVAAREETLLDCREAAHAK